MDIKIKKLTPELLDDYLHFFDDVAFTDHKEWSKCYCMFFHLTDEIEKKIVATDGDAARDFAIDYVKTGRINGYLAYVDGAPVGWLNIDKKSAYHTLSREQSPEHWGKDEISNIKSVVCFTVAPDMRGKGIASKLLDHAINTAKTEGCDAIEAYPITGNGDMFSHYHGPMGIFESAGFSVVRKTESFYVVRKVLE